MRCITKDIFVLGLIYCDVNFLSNSSVFAFISLEEKQEQFRIFKFSLSNTKFCNFYKNFLDDHKNYPPNQKLLTGLLHRTSKLTILWYMAAIKLLILVMGMGLFKMTKYCLTLETRKILVNRPKPGSFTKTINYDDDCHKHLFFQYFIK